LTHTKGVLEQVGSLPGDLVRRSVIAIVRQNVPPGTVPHRRLCAPRRVSKMIFVWNCALRRRIKTKKTVRDFVAWLQQINLF
jgi:hypothetical protein